MTPTRARTVGIYMNEPRHIVGLSGGKDSTALALALAQFFPGPKYEFICTPTGNELPVMLGHWRNLEVLLGAPLMALIDWRGVWVPKIIAYVAYKDSSRIIGNRIAQAEHAG